MKIEFESTNRIYGYYNGEGREVIFTEDGVSYIVQRAYGNDKGPVDKLTTPDFDLAKDIFEDWIRY